VVEYMEVESKCVHGWDVIGLAGVCVCVCVS
jgi:hypothetical protein